MNTIFTQSTLSLLRELTPAQIAAFLDRRGYYCVSRDPRGFAVYDRRDQPGDPSVGGDYAIEIPTFPAHRDYALRLGEALSSFREPLPGLLHQIAPSTFPLSRILDLVGLPSAGPELINEIAERAICDDAGRWPVVPMELEGALADQEGRPVQPNDLDFYDDEEWAPSVGTPWHADRCQRNYFRHAKPTQTGDCQGAEEVTP